MKQEASKRGTDPVVLFGADAIRSNYALRSKMMHLTPRDVNVLALRPEAFGKGILLLQKPLDLFSRNGGTFSFQTEWLRGFQHGAPSRDKMIDIDAFDAQDREIKIHIGSDKGANGITQADVNRILYSLRPISVAPTGDCTGR